MDFFFYNFIVPIGISPMGNAGLLSSGKESQLRQSHRMHVHSDRVVLATQPTVHAGCISVSIIHRTLTRTWMTGSLTYAQLIMHAIAHGGVWTP